MQVIVEMVMLPLAWGAPTMVFDGEVVYATHAVSIKPADADKVRPKVFEVLKRLGLGTTRPSALPNESACRFCDVSDADCAERVGVAAEAVAQSDLF